MRSYPVLHPINIFFFLFVFYFSVYAQQRNELHLAENLLHSKNYENALTIFQKYYKTGDTSVRVINGITTCLRELGHNEELIGFLKEITKELPQIYSYSIDLGRAYFLNDQPDSAMQIWKIVYNVKPPQLMRYRLVAQAMTNFRLFDEAISVYEQALKLIPNQDAIHLDIATLYKAQLNYEKASEHYLLYYQKFKQQRNYVRSLLINMAKDDEATDRIIIAIVSFNDNNDPDLNELLANLYMRKKDYEKAFKIITEIENSRSGNSLIYLNRFANEAARDNAYNYVIKAYEFAIKKMNNKFNASMQFNLARAYYKSALNLNRLNKPKESDTRIKKALSILSDLQSKNSVEKYNAAELSGDIYENQFNDLDQALNQYMKIDLKKINVDNADFVCLKIANVFLLKNNLKDAKKYYKRVHGRKYLPVARYNLAELLFFTSEFTKSKKEYESLITNIGMNDSLANNTLDRIFQINQFLQDSINFVAYSKACLLLRQRKYSESAREFRELYFDGNIISYTAGIKAAVLYNRLDKEDEANTILEDLIKSYPDENKIDYAYFLLAYNYQKSKDLANALTMYQKILTRFPTSFYVEQARENARGINKLLQEKLNN